MLKKPLSAAEKMMTNKLKAASSKLDIGSIGKQYFFLCFKVLKKFQFYQIFGNGNIVYTVLRTIFG